MADSSSTTSTTAPALRRDSDLEIGPDRVKYCVHKALLVHHSEYFRKALQGPWKEAEEGVFRLPDIEPATVNIFVHWLYTQRLPDALSWKEWLAIIGENEDDDTVAKIKAYAIADRFMALEFQRAINNHIVDHLDRQCGYMEVSGTLELAEEVFKIIPADRPILQYLVDNHCNFWRNCCEESGSDISKLPHKFVTRAMRRLNEMLQEEQNGRTSGSRCYYEHASEAEATECGDLHMWYDEEKDFGVFGERVPCVEWWCGGKRKCQCPAPPASTASSSSSDSDSDSDSD